MSALLPLPAAGQDELRRIEQAYADADPLAALAAIDAYAGAVLAHALFTVNRHDAARMRVVRQLESVRLPAAAGQAGTAWGRHVLLEHKVFVGEGEDAIQAFFDDHAAIQALGLRSVINVPVVLDGACLGTLNFLMPRPAVSASNLHTARLLGLVALPRCGRSAPGHERPRHAAPSAHQGLADPRRGHVDHHHEGDDDDHDSAGLRVAEAADDVPQHGADAARPTMPTTEAERTLDSKRYSEYEIHSGNTCGITP